MESSGKILKNISRLIDKLISVNKKLRKENSELLRERERLMVERVEHIKQIEHYRREESVRDIYTSFVIGADDKLKAKRQLEKILREIDECIEVLNSK